MLAVGPYRRIAAGVCVFSHIYAADVWSAPSHDSPLYIEDPDSGVRVICEPADKAHGDLAAFFHENHILTYREGALEIHRWEGPRTWTELVYALPGMACMYRYGTIRGTAT